jgi:phasin
MTDTKKTTPKREKTVEEAVSPTKANVTSFPGLDTSEFELPEMVRDMAEKSVTQAKEAYDNVKNAAEEATDMMEDTYEATRKGLVEMNLKLIDQAQANTDRAFAFAKELVSAKSFSDAIELQNRFAREQYESFSTQAKDFQAMSKQIANETTQPIKEVWQRSAEKMKVA